MCRSARIVVPGLPHHVTQRGNYRQPVFTSDDERRLYLRLLREFSDVAGVRIWAWCLMDNHAHLVAVPDAAESLGRALGRTHAAYARHVHARTGRTGHLWQARFHSCLLDDAHLRTAIRYVELNPVRAGLVPHAEAYPWSSARAHLTGCPCSILDDDCPVDDTPDEWRQFLADGLTDEQLTALRNATRTGRPAANRDVLRELERATGISLLPRRRGRRPGPQWRPVKSGS